MFTMTKHGCLITYLLISAILSVSKAYPGYNPTSQRLAMESYNGCDNGQTDLEVDWNPDDKTIFACKEVNRAGVVTLRPKGDPLVKTEECQVEADEPQHKCMSERIIYSDPLPTSGAHRPVWPAYGEYEYIPVQRWLHALEHGGIVALYHPCADRQDVKVLKGVTGGCLRRHIISPYPAIPRGYNFALLAWKCKFLFQTPNIADMVAFIQKHALQGPEDAPTSGAYTIGLLYHAPTVTDLKDSIVCPTTAQRNFLSTKIKESSFVNTKESSLTNGLGTLSQKFRSKFEPFKNIVELSGGFLPDKESFSKDLHEGYDFLRNEEKNLESTLEKSEEKLQEIKAKLLEDE